MQTFEIAKQLERVGVEETHAYEIAEAINGRSGLATKEDIYEVRDDVKDRINNVEKTLECQIHSLRTEVRTEIHDVEKNLEGQMNKLDNRMGKLETSNKWLVAIQLAILALLLKDVFFQ